MMNKRIILAASLLGTVLCTTGTPSADPYARNHGKQHMAADPRDGLVQWDQSKYHSEIGMYVTPVRFRVQDESKTAALYKYLVSEKAEAGNTGSGYYLYLSVNREATDPELLKQIPDNLPSGFFAGKEELPGLTGAVMRYSLKYEWQSGTVFEKGVPVKGQPKMAAEVKGEYVPVDDPAFLDKAAVKCTSYYLMVTDENGQIISVTYLFTSCEEQDPGGGGGNGGGNGTPPNPSTGAEPSLCEMKEEEAAEVLRNVTGTDDLSDPKYAIGQQLPPDQQGKIRRVNNPYMGLVDLHIFWDYSTHYTAFFNGINYKNSEQDFWKWESCVYSRSVMDGGSVPPCMELLFSASGSPCVISPDEKTVTASVDFQIIAKISCLGSVQVGNVYASRRRQIFYADMQY